MENKILIVDDDPLSRELLTEYLFGEKYTVLTAENAAAARTIIHNDQPDLILLDVMMPGEDGFSFCRIIKENWQHPFLPVILVTALTDKKSRLHGLDCGADDFLSKPVDALELLIKVRNMLKIRDLHANLYNELVFARRVQENLFFIHDALREDDKIFYQPCQEVGGDLIEVWDRGSSRWALLADASGHGPSAALIAAAVKALIDKDCSTPADLMNQINGKLYSLLNNEDISYFVTAICIKAEAQKLSFVGAGHPPGLLKGKNSLLQLDSNYLPLGIRPRQPFKNLSFDYDPDDLLFLYSDGLFDILDEWDLKTLLKRAATGQTFHQKLLEKIKQKKPGDDLSFLTLRL